MSAPITPERNSRIEYLLEQLIEKVEEEAGGSQIKYGGRVDTVNDLPAEGEENQFYFVGLESADNWDEYIWAIPAAGETGHWDRLGSVTIIVDTILDTTSNNPIANSAVATAVNQILAALALKANSADLAPVATTGSYEDLTDKPEAPDLTPYAKSKMIADPYDSTATYADGDLFTFEGELYKVDSVNGQYISTGNLITAEVMTTAAGYINGKIPSYSSGAYTPETFLERWDYRTSGYIEVTPGMTMSIDVGGPYSTGNYDTCDSFYNADKTRIGAFNNNGSGVSSSQTRSYVIPAGVKYVRLGLGPANYQPSPVAKLVRADMPKVVKTTVDSELNAKADSADLATVATSGDYSDLSNKPTIPDAVTVTQTGDMYIGAVCVRKVLTQAEYDLLDPPDERCDYKIVPATT